MDRNNISMIVDMLMFTAILARVLQWKLLAYNEIRTKKRRQGAWLVEHGKSARGVVALRRRSGGGARFAGCSNRQDGTNPRTGLPTGPMRTRRRVRCVKRRRFEADQTTGASK